MTENKAICKECADKAKAEGYLVHHLLPYLRKNRNRIRCARCKKVRYHEMYLNGEFCSHPRKVRVIR